MSANKTNKTNDSRSGDKTYQQHSSGMTPSIITTINNTSPTPPVTNASSNSIVAGSTNPKYKRQLEPYESYIEDSFVGHWEREDDDIDDDYGGSHAREEGDGMDEESLALHPSTIEFDFDSFGPESFIYTPAAPKQSLDEDSKQTAQTTKQLGVNVEQAENKVHLKPEDRVVPKEDEQQLQEPEEHSAQPQRSQEQGNKVQIGQSDNLIINSHEPRALNFNQPDNLVDLAQVDLRVIEPYKKVISHAGYCHYTDPSAPPPKPGEPAPAIIVFSACYLPDRSRRDYNYVMDQLFLYVLSSLHELIADDYILIYLHNAQPSSTTGNVSSKTSSSSNLASGSGSTINEEAQQTNNLPTFTWMKRCYQMIDRRLRKNLKILYLVKPTFWLKTIVIMCKPFISTKFSKKLRFIDDMDGLKKCLPVDKLILPASAENL